MAAQPAIVTVGLRKLQRDLRAMAPDASITVRQTIKDALEPMRRVAVSRAPGTGRTIGSRWRATVRGAQGALTNTHPGARPHEFGGTIEPRGVPIKLAKAGMIYGPAGALERGKDEVEKDLLTGFQRLARAHGWH